MSRVPPSIHITITSTILDLTIIHSHIAEGANTTVKTIANCNEKIKQSNTTDKSWLLFFFCVCPFQSFIDNVFAIKYNSLLHFLLSDNTSCKQQNVNINIALTYYQHYLNCGKFGVLYSALNIYACISKSELYLHILIFLLPLCLLGFIWIVAQTKAFPSGLLAVVFLPLSSRSLSGFSTIALNKSHKGSSIIFICNLQNIQHLSPCKGSHECCFLFV